MYAHWFWLQIELSRASLREMEAREEVVAIQAEAAAAATDLTSMRLVLSSVGIGVHPAEAVAKLLTSLRTLVARKRDQLRTATTRHGGRGGVDDSSPSPMLDTDGPSAATTLNREFYTADSLATFEDLVRNIMTIQAFDLSLIHI